MEFKDRIRLLRTNAKMSTAKLAAEFDKSDTAIRMWETGKSKPDVDTLIKLVKYFGVTTDYLLGLPDDRVTTIEIQKPIASYSDAELLAEVKRRMKGVPHE